MSKKNNDKKEEVKVNSEEEKPFDVDGLDEAEAKDLLKKSLKENEELIVENEKLHSEAEENHNDYLRARADCENVRKRKAEEVRNAYDDGKLEAVSKILAIGDSLDWALKMELDDKTREGIEKLVKKYHEALESLGVKEFSPEEGSEFDPNTAAAVMQVDGEGEDKSGTIKNVFGRGFKLGEKVIRYAQVSVVK